MGLQVAHGVLTAEAAAKGEPAPPLPRIFTNPIYVQGSTWELSTSHLPTKHSRVTGFHTVVPWGIGVTYQLFEATMTFAVSSDASCATTDSLKYRDELSKMLHELHRLLASCNMEEASKLFLQGSGQNVDLRYLASCILMNERGFKPD